MGLVLSRNLGEEVIHVDKNNEYVICVTISQVHGKQVQLCFDAPDFVSIDRSEIYLKKHSPNNPIRNPEITYPHRKRCASS